MLEAKVDVRDGLAWSSLDKYIKGLEGSGTVPAVPSSPHAQAHESEAAAAAGAADSEEEADPGLCVMYLLLFSILDCWLLLLLCAHTLCYFIQHVCYEITGLVSIKCACDALMFGIGI